MTFPNPPGTKASRLFGGLSIPANVWAEYLPQFASRMVPPVPTWQALAEWHQHDIVRGVAHGYEKRPEVLDSWNGQHFQDFIRHVMDGFGVPVFSFVFGLDPELEARLQFRDMEDIAGAARLAVLGASSGDVPEYQEDYRGSPKYDSSNAPQLDMGQSLRRLMLFERHQPFMGYIDFFGLEDDAVAEAFTALSAKMTHGQVLSLMGPLMLEAQRQGIDLGECLLMWAATLAPSEKVVEFVRSGIPVDYARLLTDDA